MTEITQAMFDAARDGLRRSPIAAPKAIADLIWAFYRPVNRQRSHVLAILESAKQAVIKAPKRASAEELSMLVSGRVLARMNQIRNGTAKGRWVLGLADEREAIADFADFLVLAVLDDLWHGDRAQFSAKSGIGLIEDAVYFLMLEFSNKHHRQYQQLPTQKDDEEWTQSTPYTLPTSLFDPS